MARLGHLTELKHNGQQHTLAPNSSLSMRRLCTASCKKRRNVVNGSTKLGSRISRLIKLITRVTKDFKNLDSRRPDKALSSDVYTSLNMQCGAFRLRALPDRRASMHASTSPVV